MNDWTGMVVKLGVACEGLAASLARAFAPLMEFAEVHCRCIAIPCVKVKKGRGQRRNRRNAR